ncbi:sigma-70 family RNA polymerase sigma factor [Winogradskya consettensis]|uniref:Siderophore-interacting protein n=1 Tax=Winogradskya consettensis TaxID=113560 RepID=A0A919SHQ7_9ACTN|nr:RNA polymerase sigma factor [Actinoplanes consettensis]GIM71762.1 siderophore-interacting protein [Actinoplanes consettensis]
MTTDLRALVRAGDRDAFAQLFDRYARAVYNHGFRLTADWALADDVVSATFLQAWNLRGRVDPEGGSLRPWLLGIATNITRNLRRGDRRYRAAALACTRLEQVVPDHAGATDSRIDDGRRLAAAMAILAALPRADREVFTLCVWEELDYASAAEALGIPIGTVRSRLSRARDKIRRELPSPDRQVKGDHLTTARHAEGTR